MSQATIDKFREVQFEAHAIFKRKNRDYGDSFREDGPLGVMIRMKDKLSRFIALARYNGEAACKDEVLRDTLIDLHNYSAMAVLAIEAGEPMVKQSPQLFIEVGDDPAILANRLRDCVENARDQDIKKEGIEEPTL